MKRAMLKATKAKKKRALFCAALFAAALFFPACTMEPIFATIENEIELRNPNLEGVVPSLVQYYDGTNYWLFACNGYVKKKAAKADPGSWETVSIPFSRCGKLVVIEGSGSNADTLYALAQDGDWGFQGIYEYNGSGWDSVTLDSGLSGAKQIQIGASTDGFYAVGYFGEGSDTSAADDYEVYEYDGSSWSSLGTLSESPIGFGGDYILTKRRPYKVSNGSISAMSTNESTVSVSGSPILPGGDYDNKGMCIDPEHPERLYVLTDDYIWSYVNSSWSRASIGTSTYDGFGTPAFFDGDQPLVLMPLEEGYREAVIDNSSGAINGTQTVGTSSTSTVATTSRSQYRSSIDDYSIDFMFTVTDSNYLPSGCDYAVYASIGHYKYSGLWGYYQGVQQEWDRE